MKLKRGQWIIAIFTLAYIIAFTIFYISKQNYEFLIYAGVLVVVGATVLLTINKSKLNYLALWGLSLWGLIHLLGGSWIINGTRLYGIRIVEIISGEGQFYILKMDQVIHLYGFAVAAIVVFQLIYPRINKIHPGLIIFLAFIGSMGLGALNEVVEFIAFLALEKTGVGDLYNFGLDLVFNGIGALIGSIIGYSTRKYVDKI
ncbi:hypothetical protein CMI47_22715 [Candidatus Pacearchaeota archaeon]|nr:hypothetical protein [Candidatus Pacearchaeota archaeon]|tara:strand:- start:373 stop:978 length:606 start_codon:yes stop_codon:yes gene_type:complete